MFNLIFDPQKLFIKNTIKINRSGKKKKKEKKVKIGSKKKLKEILL